jgi:hypothetical protein
MQQRLAAGKGHAPGIPEEDLVFPDFFEKPVLRIPFAVIDDRTARTCLNDRIPAAVLSVIQGRSSLPERQLIFFRGFPAAAAVNAAAFKIHRPLPCLKPFGILAPGAPQQTALEEYRRADAAAIMDCESLDVEDQCPLRCDHSPFFR